MPASSAIDEHAPCKRPRAGAPSSSMNSSQQPRPYDRTQHFTRGESGTDISATATDLTDTSASFDAGVDGNNAHVVTESKQTTEKTKRDKANEVKAPPKESPKVQLKEVMENNLELMLEVVLRLREDKDFASNIYNNCHRLQHMLDQHPDLRPLFADPTLVRISFENVYREAGGILPEHQKPKSLLQLFVQSPLFKVLKVFIFAKKILTCVMGGGVSMAGAMFAGCFTVEDAVDAHDGDQDGANQEADLDETNRENKDALDRAADRMEDKETQQRMHSICEEHDPQKLLEEIEDNPDLKALRDANPLCAELMSDPDTMKILVDPDNLRCLGDASELIEQDFANPDWSPPDIPDDLDGLDLGDGDAGLPDDLATEQTTALDTVAELELETDDFLDAQEEMDLDGGDTTRGQSVLEEPGHDSDARTGTDTALDEEAGIEDQLEQDEDGMEYEVGEADDAGKNNQRGSSKGGQKKPPPKQQNKNQEGGGGGGMLGNLRAGLQDMVAAELVGMSISEATGGGDDLGALEEAAEGADDAATGMEESALVLDSAADAIDEHGDALDGLEDGLDGAEEATETSDADKGRKGAKMGAAAGAGAAAGGGVAVATSRKGKRGEGNEDGQGEEEEEKKGRFGGFGGFAGSLSTAFKEHVASNFLGDDLGEMLVEKVEEESSEEESSEDDSDDDSDYDSDYGDVEA